MNDKTIKLVSRATLFTIVFMLGLWVIDMNMSLANLQASGLEVKIGTLLVDNFDSRIHYHLGILMTIVGFIGHGASIMQYSREEKVRFSK